MDDSGDTGDSFVLLESGRRWVVHAPVDRYGQDCLSWIDVKLFDEGMRAASYASLEGWYANDAMRATDPRPPAADQLWTVADFFALLADDWRGWTGIRRWRSMETGLDLDARHDGRGHVELGVTLRRSRSAYFDLEAWSTRSLFTLEAGEQLSNLAHDLSAFLNRSHPRTGSA